MDWLEKLKFELKNVDKIGLGIKVQVARENLGISQTELSKKVSTDQSTISAIESARKAYSARKLADIALFFNDDFGLESLKQAFSEVSGNSSSVEAFVKKQIESMESGGKISKRSKEAALTLAKVLDRELAQIRNQTFDLEAAVLKYRTLESTLEAWLKFEGKGLPRDFSLSFDGWNKLSLDAKVTTVKQVKEAIDTFNRELDAENPR